MGKTSFNHSATRAAAVGDVDIHIDCSRSVSEVVSFLFFFFFFLLFFSILSLQSPSRVLLLLFVDRVDNYNPKKSK